MKMCFCTFKSLFNWNSRGKTWRNAAYPLFLWHAAPAGGRSCVEISGNGWNNSDSEKQQGTPRPHPRPRREEGWSWVIPPPGQGEAPVSLSHGCHSQGTPRCVNSHIAFLLVCCCLNDIHVMFVLIHRLLCCFSSLIVCVRVVLLCRRHSVCVSVCVYIYGSNGSPVASQITLSPWSQSPAVLFSHADETAGAAQHADALKAGSWGCHRGANPTHNGL